jgi:lipid II:glycine glycyltransferase (peptidoglycan interpeptide bridge formation enzyme)
MDYLDSGMNYEELERRMYADGATDTLAYQAVLACLDTEDYVDEAREEAEEIVKERDKIERDLDDVKRHCERLVIICDQADDTDLESCVAALDRIASIIEGEIL